MHIAWPDGPAPVIMHIEVQASQVGSCTATRHLSVESDGKMCYRQHKPFICLPTDKTWLLKCSTARCSSSSLLFETAFCPVHICVLASLSEPEFEFETWNEASSMILTQPSSDCRYAGPADLQRLQACSSVPQGSHRRLLPKLQHFYRRQPVRCTVRTL